MEGTKRKRVAKKPAALACEQCREKHMSCTAGVPACERCIERGIHCTYVESQRGKTGKNKKKKLESGKGVTTVSSAVPSTMGTAVQVMSPARTWTDLDGQSPVGSSSSALSPSARPSLRSEGEHLTNSYFTNFHAAHPILVPRDRYDLQQYPGYVKIVVKFIGAHYAPTFSGNAMKAQVASMLDDGSEKTPEMVQALLLYAIGLHSRYEPMEAMPVIYKAANMAIELGMHLSEYASTHGHGDPIYEESFRRTWWELFVTEGYLAALHRFNNFRTNNVTATAYLPCDDHYYADGASLPPLVTLVQFDDRLWADEDIQFSSYSYRIDAVRILARVIAVSSANETHAHEIQAIDNAVASWKHDLPNNKASIIDRNGDGDQIMFQAFTIINLASIFLHFPRSELPVTMPQSADIACAQQHMEQVSATSTQHAAKAQTAARHMTDLASLPMGKHSPLFICGLVFACIVQLSACSAHPQQQDFIKQNRERVGLILGTLKSFSRTWVIAQHVLQQLKRAANDTFTAKPDTSDPGTSSSSMDSGVDMMSFPADPSPWLDLLYHDGMYNNGMMGTEMMGFAMPS